MTSEFKTQYPVEKRLSEANRIRDKYPDRIPVIVEKSKNEKNLPTIDKKKYLVPSELTIGQFHYVIRKRIKLAPEKALFIFCNNTLPPTAAMMSSFYEQHRDPDDNFLYFVYSSENTFGDIPKEFEEYDNIDGYANVNIDTGC